MAPASCPSCGATVEFKSSASVFAVCEYCHSALVRHDLDIENLGRMADLKVDGSPIRLGAQGRYREVHFGLIGRIQLRYERGIWNEWHILFDDGRSGWLGEAQGTYAITFLTPAAAELP